MARPTKYAKAREQDRRDKISITRCLNKLFDIEKELEENQSEMNVPALRLRADISVNLLKKRMPDLKMTELKGFITLKGSEMDWDADSKEQSDTSA